MAPKITGQFIKFVVTGKGEPGSEDFSVRGAHGKGAEFFSLT